MIETQNNRPEGVPEKFWDAEKQTVNVDALLKSYLALEQKLSMRPSVPDSPDAYDLKLDHGLFTVDPEVNSRLHGKGFTAEQVQMVYDLAAEKLMPMIAEMAEDLKADREVEKLIAFFGGAEKWQVVSRQLLAFGKKNLPPDVLEGLAGSYEGVMALYRMMKADEPALSREGDAADEMGEQAIFSLMRDPKYWRDRDPTTVGKVTSGFQKLYGGK